LSWTTERHEERVVAMASVEATDRMLIEVWSDISCPWCYLGKHRLEQAIAGSPHAGSIDLVFHSFELDPTASTQPQPLLDMLAAKMGVSPDDARAMDDRVGGMARAEGMPYTSDRVVANSFDLHRVVQLAETLGKGTELLTGLYRDLFSGTADVYEHKYLVEAAAGLGIPAERVTEVLESDEFAEDVRRDIATAAQLGVRGVPFTVLDKRYGIPGATSVEGFAGAIEQAWGAR
jgi:predicted DsbA family dithiol-disulfide isomerase